MASKDGTREATNQPKAEPSAKKPRPGSGIRKEHLNAKIYKSSKGAVVVAIPRPLGLDSRATLSPPQTEVQDQQAHMRPKRWKRNLLDLGPELEGAKREKTKVEEETVAAVSKPIYQQGHGAETVGSGACPAVLPGATRVCRCKLRHWYTATTQLVLPL